MKRHRDAPELVADMTIKYYWSKNEWYVGSLIKKVKNPKGTINTKAKPASWWLVEWHNDPNENIIDLSSATHRLRKPGQWVIVDNPEEEA